MGVSNLSVFISFRELVEVLSAAIFEAFWNGAVASRMARRIQKDVP